jgi:2-polyprenyl-6-methoxyphenol hydroxylase-like FAD-dependent oxidoreductase
MEYRLRGGPKPFINDVSSATILLIATCVESSKERIQPMKQRTVEIAGAGLSGLAASVRFAQLGWKVTLHERAADLRMFGAGIWLWESGLKTLEMLGAYNQATARARIIKEWRIEDQKGRRLMTRATTPQDRFLLPPRADLYQALIDQAVATGVNIMTSSVVTNVRPEGVAVMQDGSERHADLVIAADGAHSRLRENILATAWMDYGIEAGIRMMIDNQPGDPTDIVTEYWNGPWRLLYNPCTEGQNYIFLSTPVNQEATRILPVDPGFWAEKFPVVADLCPRFGEASRWDRLVNVRCRQWSDGHVAIIGDAAHAMPPNLGQAANTAFITGMALADIVTKSSDIPAALREWERVARPLADHVQWFSYIYGFVVGKWPSPVVTLRSDMLRMVSGTEWFDEALNRGARHVPAGYAEFARAKLPKAAA